MYRYSIITVFLLLACLSCKNEKHTSALFTLLPESKTGISFSNRLENTERLNTYTYRNFYNGAGVGLGDFNKDGLIDIYFCGNQQGNKLYLNKGNFSFTDITDKAGVASKGSWSTGVTIADVNGDGWPDIYVCKSGDPQSPGRANQLFINNENLTFTEKAEEYGLNITGLSNHASFFDYDRDGDLDCYLLTNSFQSVTDFNMKPGEREKYDSLGGNRLLRNDDNHFIDVSKTAGIFGSKIGFGLGVSVGDLNRDGWPDIYISNDFFERDYLYINNRNGTFTECLEEQMREISQGAMGADMADINNDGWPEIFATEMTPEGNSRLKTKALFDTWQTYQLKVKSGYGHQFARNVLQLNKGNGTFSEIGRFSGVSATDWSWGALIMDLDNDGWKDIFVANGIYRDLLDRDYLNIYSNPTVMRSMIRTEDKAILKMIEMIPSVAVPNYAFRNNRDLTFTNEAEKWGLATPSFSNGAAYGDLDNDGDIDLVVNNVNMPAFIYRNESSRATDLNFLTVKLKGKDKNTEAIGANATIYYNGKIQYQEVIPARGFQSSSDIRLHYGISTEKKIDSLLVTWPDGTEYTVINPSVNQFLNIDEKDSKQVSYRSGAGNKADPDFRKTPSMKGIAYIHRETPFIDFERDKLLFNALTNEGPHMAIADVDGDGLDDFYLCGGRNQAGELYMQQGNGIFTKCNTDLFEKDKLSEETDCIFFDANGDKYPDLYVACGGNEFPSSASTLSDRLYINDGKGNFRKTDQILPTGKFESTSCVRACDFDGDGDQDLFVGIRLHPFAYGIPANGYLLENDGNGKFSDVSSLRAPGLKNIGMITDMVWADIDNDGDNDMAITGDWMPVKIFINNNGTFADETEKYGLSETQGWWHRIIAKDINGDGRVDFILGNHGLNSFFKASSAKPLSMYVNDFDLNGSIEQLICCFNGDKSYPVAMMDDLENQIPSLSSKYKKFADYKDQTINDLFAEDILKRSLILRANDLASSIIINSGNGKFSLYPLPAEAQFAPVYAILAEDLDGDGICDILLAGNQERAKPQTGIYDASYGLFLKGNKDGSYSSTSPLISGFSTKGEIRDLKILKTNEGSVLSVIRNNDNLEFYKY